MSKTEKNTGKFKFDVLRNWREVLHDERMAHLIKDAFRCTSSGLQRRLKEHSILYGHWTFLRILWQTDGLTQRQLSGQAGVTEPSAFTALQAMEKLAYITRQKMPDNKKQVRIFLTLKGISLRSLSVPCAEEVNRLAIAGISPEDLAATRRTLLTIIDNLNRDVIAPPDQSDNAPRDNESGEGT